MKRYWEQLKIALRLQRWPIISNADQILIDQKRRLDRLYGLKDK